MKYLLVAIMATLFSFYSFAETTLEQSQKLKDNNCVPYRDTSGQITYNCDQSPAGEMKNGNVEKLGVKEVRKYELKKGDVITAVDGQPVDSPAKAMELYQNLKKNGTVTIQQPKTVSE